MTIPDDVDAMAILDPILPELRRALAAVLPIGFGQITLHIEHGAIQRVVFSVSLKRQRSEVIDKATKA